MSDKNEALKAKLVAKLEKLNAKKADAAKKSETIAAKIAATEDALSKLG